MIRNILPYSINKPLFGDRRRYGKEPPPQDAEWERWQQISAETFEQNQRRNSFFSRVNDSGYSVLNKFDLSGKVVCELGPGHAFHLDYFNGIPALYNLLDRDSAFLKSAESKAAKLGITTQSFKITEPNLPFESNSHDFVLSFYSLEHLHPLSDWISEFFRILKPGGVLVGAIPSEGSLTWGLGRWLTNRRFFKNKYGLDLDKIICWEHVNFSDEIIASLKERGSSQFSRWPLKWAPLDFSLIIQFSIFKSNPNPLKTH